jgi:predicted esterase
MKKFIALALFLMFLSCLNTCSTASTTVNCDTQDSTNYVKTTVGCLYIKVFKSDSISAHPNLVFIVHGDAPFAPPSYQYTFGKMVSELSRNTIVVSILRPGYSDNEGNRSEGMKGKTTGDNYTPEVINAISEAVTKLKKMYNPRKSIIVGHSGGAAISADIISVSPQLFDTAILVSCPCDLDLWRAYMASKQPFVWAWKDSVSSVSPILVFRKIHPRTVISLIHGASDETVPITIAKKYFDSVFMVNPSATFKVLDNAGHEILLSTAILNVIKGLL